MIISHLHDAQECQAPSRPIREYLDHQPSNAERCGRLLLPDAREVTANQVHILQRLWLPVQARSQRSHVNINNTYGSSSITIDEILTDLVTFPNCIILSRRLASSFEASRGSINKKRDDFMGVRHSKSSGNEWVRRDGHQKVSLFVGLNVGPMALSSQEVFTA